jgi:surfeit locus 1 family protein
MEGYFEEERFLVSREKDGKRGYLVFAPFVYRHELPTSLDKNGKTLREFVIVNIGWIPIHLKDSISMNYDQSELVEYSEETHPGFLHIHDGFERNPESENNYMPLSYINGIIRKGETKDVTRGLNNWPTRHYYRMIDLLQISKSFRLPNMGKTSSAYIELIA